MAKNEGERPTDPPRRAEQAETQDEPQSKPASGRARQILFSLVLLVGLVAGSAAAAVVAAMFVVKPVQSEAAPAEQEPLPSEDGDECDFTLDQDLLVNVYQTQQRRYLSVRPVFVVASKEGLEELKEKAVELQHILIGMLKGKTLEQLDDPQITNTLGREIMETVNLKLDLESPIVRVRFTQFVVQ